MFTKVLYAAAILVLALLMEKTTSQADADTMYELAARQADDA